MLDRRVNLTTASLVIVIFSMTFIFLIGFACWAAWHYRYYYLKNRFRAVFTNESKQIIPRVLKLASKSETFTNVKGVPGTYKLMRGRIYTTGGYKMPTSYYVVGQDTPMDMQEEVSGAVNSVRFREVAEQKVMADLLTSFKKTIIDNATALVISVVVTLLAALMLGVFMNDKLTKISERLPDPVISTGEPLDPTTIPTPVPASFR